VRVCCDSLDRDERVEADRVLSEWLRSDDETLRFDAGALIRQFKIKSALPELRTLAARLAFGPGRGDPYELEKVAL